MITGLNVPFDQIKQKQYYDADGIPIPESDIINHPHIGHSVDRDNFLRLNFGQEYVNQMYSDNDWEQDDFWHIQGLPIYAKWLKNKKLYRCLHASCNC